MWSFGVYIVGNGCKTCGCMLVVAFWGLGKGQRGVGGSIRFSGACVGGIAVGKRVIVCVGS